MIDTDNSVSFDLETTGVDTSTARIVTSSILDIRGGQVTDVRRLADPGCEIPEGATAVHGITTAYARAHGQPHDRVVADTAADLRDAWSQRRPVIIYNAPYDLSVMQTWCPGFAPSGPVIDPLVLDKAIDTYRKGSRRLGDVAAHYGIRLDNAHDSSADADAAWRIAHAILSIMDTSSKKEVLTAPDGTTLTATHREIAGDDRLLWIFQQNKAVEQQRSLAAYFARTGRVLDRPVAIGWPLEGHGAGVSR